MFIKFYYSPTNAHVIVLKQY